MPKIKTILTTFCNNYIICWSAAVKSAVLIVRIQIVHADVHQVTSPQDVISLHRYKMDPLLCNAD